MNAQSNDSEAELNKYFVIIEKDLEVLARDKGNQALRKKVSSNLGLVPYELEYYEMLVDGAADVEKKTLSVTLDGYRQRLKKAQERFAKLTNAPAPSATAEQLALNPQLITEATAKINVCDMKRCLNRGTAV